MIRRPKTRSSRRRERARAEKRSFWQRRREIHNLKLKAKALREAADKPKATLESVFAAEKAELELWSLRDEIAAITERTEEERGEEARKAKAMVEKEARRVRARTARAAKQKRMRAEDAAAEHERLVRSAKGIAEGRIASLAALERVRATSRRTARALISAEEHSRQNFERRAKAVLKLRESINRSRRSAAAATLRRRVEGEKKMETRMKEAVKEEATQNRELPTTRRRRRRAAAAAAAAAAPRKTHTYLRARPRSAVPCQRPRPESRTGGRRRRKAPNMKPSDKMDMHMSVVPLEKSKSRRTGNHDDDEGHRRGGFENSLLVNELELDMVEQEQELLWAAGSGSRSSSNSKTATRTCTTAAAANNNNDEDDELAATRAAMQAEKEELKAAMVIQRRQRRKASRR